jgi:hypothetical protein
VPRAIAGHDVELGVDDRAMAKAVDEVRRAFVGQDAGFVGL